MTDLESFLVLIEEIAEGIEIVDENWFSCDPEKDELLRALFANTYHSSTMAKLTIRLVRSFQDRNVRPLVLKDIQLSATTLSDLLVIVKEELQNPSWRSTAADLPIPFRSALLDHYDQFAVEGHAFGCKGSEVLINRKGVSNAPYMGDGRSLQELGIQDETDLSLFNIEDYRSWQCSSSASLKKVP
ncbi:hypothetical protein ACOME3_008684 [Neoechinorhynchus agilis]